MGTRTRGFARRLWPLALLAAGNAWAAGGHHAVDDAAILEPGQCELEGWVSRASGRERLLHAGVNCRLGPVELGAASEYARADGASATDWGVEAKWAMEVAEGFSVGARVGPGWSAHVRPRYQGVAAVALATWQPREGLALHFNLGRDFAHRAADQTRYGAAIEWSPRKAWSLVAERYREQDAHFWRAGLRLAGGENWSVDASRAQRLAGPGVSHWTLGASFVFDR